MAKIKKIDQMDFVRVTKLADETSPEAEIYLNLSNVRYLRVEGDTTKVVYGQEGFFVKEDPKTIFSRAKLSELSQ